MKYIEAPGRSAVGVTAFYKSVPDGCCERAFVAYGDAKKPSRRDVDRLVQGILRDRGAEVHVSEHSERGEWGYLVAARSSEATDEAADGLRKLLSAGRAARQAPAEARQYKQQSTYSEEATPSTRSAIDMRDPSV